MASIPLNEVPAPENIRDLISSEWSQYRAWRGAGAPETVRATNWATPGRGAPSHARGRAIDLVTSDWSDRRYLVEFGLWLAVRRQAEQINCIFYRRDYEPHLHVADWSGRVSKPEASIGVNTGVQGKYNYFLPPYEEKANEIIKALRDVAATYKESKDVEIDWDYWVAVLQGSEKPPWDSVGGKLQAVIAFVKRRWWLLLLPIVIGVPLFVLMRRRDS